MAVPPWQGGHGGRAPQTVWRVAPSGGYARPWCRCARRVLASLAPRPRTSLIASLAPGVSGPGAAATSPAAVRRWVLARSRPSASMAPRVGLRTNWIRANGPEGFAFLRVARGKLQPPAMMRVRVSEDQNSHGIRRAVFKLALEGFDRPHLSTTRRAIPAANQRQVQDDVDGVLLYCLLHPLARAFEGNYLVADLYQQTLERPCASFTKTLISSPLSSIYGAPRLRAVTQSISDRQVRFAAVLHVRLTAARQTRGFAPAQRHATSHREGR